MMQANPILGWKSVQVITWVAPAVAIPALRYFQDAREQRKTLFLRDASTYALGTTIYFAVGFLAKKTLTALNLFKNAANRDFIAFLLALTANILYAGIGAVKLSQLYARKHPSAFTMPPTSTPFKSPLCPTGTRIARPPGFAGFQTPSSPRSY